MLSRAEPEAGAERLRLELERLAGMDLPGLQARWRRVFGRSAPRSLPRVLLHRTLAYRLQAEALGNLDRETLRPGAGATSSCRPVGTLRSCGP